MTNKCAPAAERSQRVFWTTQPDACGVFESCDSQCGIPGLRVLAGAECNQEGAYQPCPPLSKPLDPNCAEIIPKTFATNDWVRGLLINILNTDGRLPPSKCGVAPGAQGGHWSDSYREDGQSTGTLLWHSLSQSFSRIQDAVNVVRAQVALDASKLVKLGVAVSVDVKAEYAGSNKIAVVVTIVGPNTKTSVVNLTADRLTNRWVWK